MDHLSELFQTYHQKEIDQWINNHLDNHGQECVHNQIREYVGTDANRCNASKVYIMEYLMYIEDIKAQMEWEAKIEGGGDDNYYVDTIVKEDTNQFQKIYKNGILQIS